MSKHHDDTPTTNIPLEDSELYHHLRQTLTLPIPETSYSSSSSSASSSTSTTALYSPQELDYSLQSIQSNFDEPEPEQTQPLDLSVNSIPTTVVAPSTSSLLEQTFTTFSSISLRPSTSTSTSSFQSGPRLPVPPPPRLFLPSEIAAQNRPVLPGPSQFATIHPRPRLPLPLPLKHSPPPEIEIRRRTSQVPTSLNLPGRIVIPPELSITPRLPFSTNSQSQSQRFTPSNSSITLATRALSIGTSVVPNAILGSTLVIRPATPQFGGANQNQRPQFIPPVPPSQQPQQQRPREPEAPPPQPQQPDVRQCCEWCKKPVIITTTTLGRTGPPTKTFCGDLCFQSFTRKNPTKSRSRELCIFCGIKIDSSRSPTTFSGGTVTVFHERICEKCVSEVSTSIASGMESGRRSGSPFHRRTLPAVPPTTQQHQQFFDNLHEQYQLQRGSGPGGGRRSDTAENQFNHNHNPNNNPLQNLPQLRWSPEGPRIVRSTPPSPPPPPLQQQQHRRLPIQQRSNTPLPIGGGGGGGSAGRGTNSPKPSVIYSSTPPPVSTTRQIRNRRRSGRDIDSNPAIAALLNPSGRPRLSPVDEHPELLLNSLEDKDSDRAMAARTLVSLNESIRQLHRPSRHFSGGSGGVVQHHPNPRATPHPPPTPYYGSGQGPGPGAGIVPPPVPPRDPNMICRNVRQRIPNAVVVNHNHGRTTPCNFGRMEQQQYPHYHAGRPEVNSAATAAFDRQQYMQYHQNNHLQHQHQQQQQQPPPLPHFHYPHYCDYDAPHFQQLSPRQYGGPVPSCYDYHGYDSHNINQHQHQRMYHHYHYPDDVDRKRSRSEERVSSMRNMREHDHPHPPNFQGMRSHYQKPPPPQNCVVQNGHLVPMSSSQQYPYNAYPSRSLPNSPQRSRYQSNQSNGTEVYGAGRVSVTQEQYAYHQNHHHHHQQQQQQKAPMYSFHHSQSVAPSGSGPAPYPQPRPMNPGLPPVPAPGSSQQQQRPPAPPTSSSPPGLMKAGSPGPLHVKHGLFGGGMQQMPAFNLPIISNWSCSYTPIMTTTMSSISSLLSVSSATVGPILSTALSTPRPPRSQASKMPRLPPAETITSESQLTVPVSISTIPLNGVEKAGRKRPYTKRTPAIKEEDGEHKPPTKRGRKKKQDESISANNGISGMGSQGTQSQNADASTSAQASRSVTKPDSSAIPILVPVPFVIPMSQNVFNKLVNEFPSCSALAASMKPCKLEDLLRNTTTTTETKPRAGSRKKANLPKRCNSNPPASVSTDVVPSPSSSFSTVQPTALNKTENFQGEDDKGRIVAVVVAAAGESSERVPQEKEPSREDNHIAGIPFGVSDHIVEDAASMDVAREEIVVMYGVDDDDDSNGLIIHEGVASDHGQNDDEDDDSSKEPDGDKN